MLVTGTEGAWTVVDVDDVRLVPDPSGDPRLDGETTAPFVGVELPVLAVEPPAAAGLGLDDPPAGVLPVTDAVAEFPPVDVGIPLPELDTEFEGLEPVGDEDAALPLTLVEATGATEAPGEYVPL